MTNNLSDKFRYKLDPGERIIWTGKPHQGPFFKLSDFSMVPFGLLWSGFAIIWEFIAVSSGASLFFKLWGVPFVLFGLYLIFGTFFFNFLQRMKTYYALTNERAQIISGIINQSTKSMVLKNLSEINIRLKSNGKGTIIFGSPLAIAFLSSGNIFPFLGSNDIAPCFEMIDNAKAVYQQIESLRAEKV